jgi:bacterioferritin (cytochrome b1)
LAKRIQQLDGQPSLDPIAMVQRAHSEYRKSDHRLDRIRENLVAECIGVAAYPERVRCFGNDGPTSGKRVEESLATMDEHADEMADRLTAIAPEAKLG